jgi:ABC-type multidrug transport system permease subunit
MRSRRILAVVRARNREFYRDKAGLGWNLVMPMLMLLGFAFLFSGSAEDEFRVGILGDRLPDAADTPFLAVRYVRFTPVPDLAAGVEKVRLHQLDLLLDPGAPLRYWVNRQSPKGYLAERLLQGAYGDRPAELRRETVSGRPVRYVDWLVPGILALNMTFSSLWGVGWVIVRYRKNGVLRRLRATPLTAFEFLFAQILSRLLVVLSVNLAVFLGADLILDFPMHGSYLALFLVFLAGSLCMISVGLLVASRIRSEELADGLLNLISWPMMILSGVWFSMEGTHALAQLAAQLLPLTHVVNGARAVMLEGAGLGETLPEIALLGTLGLVLLALAARVFRWH